MKITEENLAQNGWVFNEALYQKMKDEPFGELFREWQKDFIVQGDTYHCILGKDGNMPNRYWHIRIDNDYFDTIASLDVATYEQIDKLLELLKDEN